MEPIAEEQLALIHIGILTKHFIGDQELPESLREIEKILNNHLKVTLQKGDDVIEFRNKAIVAYNDIYGEDTKQISNSDAFDNAMKGI